MNACNHKQSVNVDPRTTRNGRLLVYLKVGLLTEPEEPVDGDDDSVDPGEGEHFLHPPRHSAPGAISRATAILHI